RSSKSTPWGRWNVEIHSVNRKFLDMSIHLPRDFLLYDIEVRKFLSSKIHRGQVTVKINFLQDEISQEMVQRLSSQLKQVKVFFEKVASELNLDVEKDLTLSFLLDQKNFVLSSDNLPKDDHLQVQLLQAVSEAFEKYKNMKEVEGSALALEIRKYLDNLMMYLSEIQALAPRARDNFKKRLLEKLQDFKQLDSLDEERVARETLIYSEKIDIEEEMARLKSHFNQFDALFSSSEKSIGRNMDFLLQEMNREVNTICSKSDLADLSHIAVRMKGELEKIREQVQNIE
ncbi:MAG: YicC family protein, partial [Chlamydiae bacterium]|nr:YicC family protein [Chlamydiota bacterium]